MSDGIGVTEALVRPGAVGSCDASRCDGDTVNVFVSSGQAADACLVNGKDLTEESGNRDDDDHTYSVARMVLSRLRVRQACGHSSRGPNTVLETAATGYPWPAQSGQ